MANRAFFLRGLRTVALTLAVIITILGGLIQFQQRMLRHRAERLLADIQSIRLHQSTWSDAQKLMHRWGAWGHYNGECSERDCQYEIVLEDSSLRMMHLISVDWAERFFQLGGLRVYNFFGGRNVSMHVRFIVQDGTIWRTSANFAIDVPREDYEIVVETRSRSALRGDHVYGAEQLAKHPNYKVWRPSACTNCILAVITYAASTPQSEILRLTSFDLSCITRFQACSTLEAVLPAAQEWHLYDNRSRRFPLPAMRCDVPVWALGRDAEDALEVEAISNIKDEGLGYRNEKAKVKIVAALKGRSYPAIGTFAIANTFGGEDHPPEVQLPEHLTPGKRYILLPYGADRENHLELFMTFCGVLDDTPEVKTELQKGFAQKDALRKPELAGVDPETRI